jgi:hypothetical protein
LNRPIVFSRFRGYDRMKKLFEHGTFNVDV